MKHLKWLGFIGGIVYWLFVSWSIHYNPWFSFFENVLSDLGDPAKATPPRIYNYGLIVTSPFVLAFSIYLISTAENKIQTVGGAYLSISSLFLALIGIFHGGTRPHVFVSTYFFVQFFLGMLIYGLGSKTDIRLTSIIIFILALLGIFIPWPSVALEETYEIVLIMLFTLFVAVRG
ncbi:hypothetical protein PF1624 [Pyrococcus furiosus DSM 3638]|uniref:DUF998 domain-containing protein n=1 Tax=Pyrococcus furiosus (strain ATCC 43587 / DSM 3638 / JCM 8422 / Vc1) TaxID=186497 RepID=Q8U0G5_PYRFU|nr:DUF998 domain-containing protein [Pyrococcus furiosus]AAL81748.1 hypothetical protein PF1624 [Pyrococcus furiosus DSM 3638]